jgi:DHHW protein
VKTTLNFIFFAALLAWGLAIFFLPARLYSDIEKRELKSLPNFSIQQFVEKKYTDSLDGYLADHFVFRDNFVNFSFLIKQYRGYKSDEMGIFEGNIDLDAGAIEVEIDSNSNNSPNPSVDSALYTNLGEAKYVKQLHSKLLIYNGKAVQIFGGENKTSFGMSTEYCAKVADQYADSLRATARVFLAIPPASGELFLPTAYKQEQLSQKRDERYCIQTTYNYLKSAKGVDICSELHLHKNEYLYFATDHHWTGRGAYYGYVAFCKQAGFKPILLDSFNRKVIPNFLGSLYRLTRDSRLANNPDSVEYFIPPHIRTAAYSMEGANYNQKVKKQVWAEIAKGENSYGVFLSRDYPFLLIETNAPTDKVALIIKNSYGNPLTTFLVSHYKRILAVDYRKFKGNVLALCRQHNVSDVIICQGVFAANTASNTQMIQKMMFSPLIVPTISRDTSAFVTYSK